MDEAKMDLQLSGLKDNLDYFEEDEELKYKTQQQLLIRRKKRDERIKLEEAAELEKKKASARRSMVYLLGKSEKFANFFKEKLQQHTKVEKSKRIPLKKLHYNKLEPKLEDILNCTEFQQDLEKDRMPVEVKVDITDKINFFKGTLRQYQIEGLIWLTILYENGVNGILADEMGLGKTIQVIALLCHLYEREVPGPFLIVAPLSTVPNWKSEFKRFAPKIPVVVFHGSESERIEQMNTINRGNFTVKNKPVQPVIITSYQIPLLESKFINEFRWQYLVIDEGHRLKNHTSKLSKGLRTLKSINKLLLTGTPIHNNLTELWSLLNFLLPHIFTDIDTFASLLAIEDMQNNEKIVKEEENTNMITTIHKVLAPFMLRRLKCDVLNELVPKKEVLVYCPLTKLQKELYTSVIQRNLAKLSGKEEKSEILYESRPKRRCTLKRNYQEMNEDELMEHTNEEMVTNTKIDKDAAQFVCRITMQSPMMMFKKIVNHPYLVHFPLKPNSKYKELLVDEQLVQQSGKMLVLDAMLAKLKKGGHKVLLFSTLVMLLDLIEEYLIMRNYPYCRLDGSDSLDYRTENIKKFNEDPEIFIFILSTRAGGLGLNLTAADTVILYDGDWNPQIDIQAQDRCHRIGQTKPVMVYTLVTKNTIDERIIKRGTVKRRLEKVIIKDGKFKSITVDDEDKIDDMDLEELKNLLETSDYSNKIYPNGYVCSDEELNQLLDRSELYEQWEKMKSR